MSLDQLSTEDLLALREGNLDKVSTDGLMKLRDMEQPVAGPSEELTKIDDTGSIDVGFFNRAAVKNLGTNPEDSIKFLQKQRPDMEFRNFQGEIYGRKQGEQAFKPLDPKGFDIQDLSDVAADVAAGIGSGVATAAGGIAGGLPGAIAAGSASSGGLEALRQYAGKLAGVNTELDTGDIGLATAFGGASPLLFGSGATAGQIAKAAAKPSVQSKALSSIGRATLPQENAEEALKETVKILEKQQGGAFKFVPEFIEFGSGISADRVRNAMTPLSPNLAAKLEVPEGTTQLDLVRKIDAEGATQVIDAVTNDVATQLRLAKNKLQDEIGTALASAEIPAEPADEILDAFFKGINKRPINVSQRKALDRIRETAKEIFSRDVLDPDGNPVLDEAGNAITEPVTKFTADALMETKQQLLDVADFYKAMERKSPEEKQISLAAENALRVIDKKLDAMMKQYDKLTGGTGANSLLSKYQEHMQLERDFIPKFETSEKAFKALRNLDSVQKKIFDEKVKKFDSKFGTTIGETADLVNTWATFSNPSFVAVSGKGAPGSARTTAFGNIMALLGGALGGFVAGMPGAAAGAVAGRAGGNVIGSPAAVDKGLRAGLAARRAVEPLSDMIARIPKEQREMLGRARQAAPVSAWQMFNSGGER